MPFDTKQMLVLLILVCCSFIAPLLASRFKIPTAVMLIILGILIGHPLSTIICGGPVVPVLADVGFMMLMFIAGLEIDFNKVRQWGLRIFLTMLLICCLVFILAFFIVSITDYPLVFGLALGAISIGLPIAILKEMDLLRTQLSQFILLLGSIGEFVTIVFLTILYFISRYGFSSQLLAGMGKLLAVLIIAGSVLKLLTAMAWWKPERFLRLAEFHDGSEMGIRTSLLLMFSFTVLALFAEVEAILGAFIGGAVLGFVLRGKHIVAQKLTTLGNGFFIPIFFFVVGARFEIGMLDLSIILGTLLLLVLMFVIRALPYLVLCFFGIKLTEILGASCLLSSPLTLLIAIATLGQELQLLGSSDQTTLILLAIVSALLFPSIFRFITLKNNRKTLEQR